MERDYAGKTENFIRDLAVKHFPVTIPLKVHEAQDVALILDTIDDNLFGICSSS